MSFWLDYVSSDDYKIIVEHFPNRPIPKRKYESISVPGRNGDILIEQDAFENVTQDYDIYISAEQEKLPLPAQRAMDWLSRGGYRRLEDTYDPECFRLAQFAGGGELKNLFNKFGKATISFNCMPQRWLKEGEHEIPISGSVTLINPTGFAARPVIRFTKNGNAESVVTVGNYVLRTGANQSGKVIEIDCYEQEVTANGQRINGITTGTFPALEGSTAVSVSNALNTVVIPRWWTI